MYYKAKTKGAAIGFLKTEIVEQRNFYIVVRTPEGVFGKDVNGIYEETD